MRTGLILVGGPNSTGNAATSGVLDNPDSNNLIVVDNPYAMPIGIAPALITAGATPSGPLVLVPGCSTRQVAIDPDQSVYWRMTQTATAAGVPVSFNYPRTAVYTLCNGSPMPPVPLTGSFTFGTAIGTYGAVSGQPLIGVRRPTRPTNVFGYVDNSPWSLGAGNLADQQTSQPYTTKLQIVKQADYKTLPGSMLTVFGFVDWVDVNAPFGSQPGPTFDCAQIALGQEGMTADLEVPGFMGLLLSLTGPNNSGLTGTAEIPLGFLLEYGALP